MKASEIREKDSATLVADIEALRRDMFNLRIGLTTGSVDNPYTVRQKRKDMARMLTILREREIAALILEEETTSK